MATFGITPVGTFPPPTADNFPEFLQWQQDGVDVGTTAVETVNFTGDVAVSVNAGGDTVTVNVTGGGGSTFTWRSVTADYTLALADNNNGLKVDTTSGFVTLLVPADSSIDFPVGARVEVLWAVRGGGLVFAPDTGVTVNSPPAHSTSVNDQNSVAFAQKTGANEWVLYGDLALA